MFGSKKTIGNVKLPHKKSTASSTPVKMTDVKEVLIPVLQHIGTPANIVVAPKDKVKLGQLIAEPAGNLSSPVYSSVSGTVLGIETYLRHDGKKVPAVRIESDGKGEIYEGITPPVIEDLDSFINAVSASGIVGLGGAGFPTATKLRALSTGKINTIVINCAECEPYLTSDTATMMYDSEWIWRGIALIETYATGIESYVFGIEKNKPRCISAMKALFAKNEKVKIKPLPPKYPQGAEKVIVYNTTKRVIPMGALPADVGVIVINVSTLAAIAKYVDTGMPLVERCVTLDGGAVAEPKNIIVPLGTAVKDIIEFGGGVKSPIGKVIFGGPMMGVAVSSLDEPTVKTTGGITVLTVKESMSRAESACIHCGRCVTSCPLDLNPTEFSKSLDIADKDERIARLEALKVSLCMECGCCSYVCPANRPLVQNNRLAKGEVREYNTHKSMLKK